MYMYILYIIITVLVIITCIQLLNYSKPRRQEDVIKTIIRGSARWASASLQDKSPMIAVLHANYAAGYLWALKDSFSDMDIQRASGVDIIEFQKKITGVQDKSTRFMINSCPEYASNIDNYFGKIAKEKS